MPVTSHAFLNLIFFKIDSQSCRMWNILLVCLFIPDNDIIGCVCVCFLENGFWSTESWSMKNTFQSKENLAWFSGKCFPFILGGKHFPEIMKNLEMSYYMLIISNLVLKLLIAIYFCFEYLFFNFIP